MRRQNLLASSNMPSDIKIGKRAVGKLPANTDQKTRIKMMSRAEGRRKYSADSRKVARNPAGERVITPSKCMRVKVYADEQNDASRMSVGDLQKFTSESSLLESI